MIVGDFLPRVPRRVSNLEHEERTLPKYLSSPPVFSGVRVERFICVALCRLFVLLLLVIVLFVLLLLVIVLSVLLLLIIVLFVLLLLVIVLSVLLLLVIVLSVLLLLVIVLSVLLRFTYSDYSFGINKKVQTW